jgi:hypothetical protein
MAIFNSYVSLPEGKSSANGPFSIAIVAASEICWWLWERFNQPSRVMI